jgi:hypothetical protein
MSFGVRLGPFRVSTRSVGVRVGPFYASTRTRRRRSPSRSRQSGTRSYQPSGPVPYYEEAPPAHLAKFSDAQIVGMAAAVVLQLIIVLVVLNAVGLL